MRVRHTLSVFRLSVVEQLLQLRRCPLRCKIGFNCGSLDHVIFQRESQLIVCSNFSGRQVVFRVALFALQ